MQTKTISPTGTVIYRSSRQAVWPPAELKESREVARAAPQRWQAPRAWCPAN